MKTVFRIFAYGTLKPEEANFEAYCRGKVSEVIPAYAYGHLYALNLGYPAMTTGDTQVSGVLLTFPNDEILPDLDELEDYYPNRPLEESLYQREWITVYDASGSSLGEVWGYRMTFSRVQQFGGVFLPSGRWRSH